MIIVTGQRRRSVELMEWRELDLEGGRWSIPASKMKAGRPHEVALSAFAAQQLKDLPVTGPFCFSDSQRRPARAHRILRTLKAAVGNDWSWHDFRRAFMTHSVANGHPREFCKVALGHQIKDRLDQAYDQHDYAPEAARVMLGWQRHVEQLVTRSPASNLVSLR